MNEFQFTPLREGRRKIKTIDDPGDLFQFTPLREGRRHSLPALVQAFPFQFTPLREGRHAQFASLRHALLFQFTPLREGRPGAGALVGMMQTISIHAPPRGATLEQGGRTVTSEYFNSRPSARGDGKRYAISANLLFNPYKSAWLNNSATQFVEIILVIFHRIIA